jgi:hypothetical protein
METKIKQGQKVKIKDGSYMTTMVNGEISHGTKDIPFPGLNKDVWTIVGFGSNLPSEDYASGKKRHNNTIIANDRNNEVWYCDNKINIHPIGKTVCPDMQDIILIVRIPRR